MQANLSALAARLDELTVGTLFAGCELGISVLQGLIWYGYTYPILVYL